MKIQKKRMKYENKNLGNFERLLPIYDSNNNKIFQIFLEYAARSTGT